MACHVRRVTRPISVGRACVPSNLYRLRVTGHFREVLRDRSYDWRVFTPVAIRGWIWMILVVRYRWVVAARLKLSVVSRP